MTLAIIGAGLSRTGTFSLKRALEQLGFGPCYHMLEVIEHPTFAEQWVRIVRGDSNAWDEVFAGYRSAVDLPASAYYAELAHHYPEAKIILTVRARAEWYNSIRGTLFADHDFREMPSAAISEVMAAAWARCFAGSIDDRDAVISAYARHTDVVRRAILKERLLVYSVREGWGPLCRFLGVSVPRSGFPHANKRSDFHRGRPCAPDRNVVEVISKPKLM